MGDVSPIFLLLSNFSNLLCNFNGNVFVQTVRNDITSRGLPFDTRSNGLSSFNLHFIGDSFDSVLGDSSKNSRKDQRIVDLILEIASSASIDPST